MTDAAPTDAARLSAIRSALRRARRRAIAWAARATPVLAITGVLLALVAPAPPAAAQPMSTYARTAFVKDLRSGTVLLDKNADAPEPPASMSKLMSLFMIFEALESGRLSMDAEFRTSSRAAALGGSKMFIREGGRVSIEDLLRGVIVQSGNDATVALAEALAGTEEAFAQLMNRRAPEIGLHNSYFANSTGWPHPDHVMTARDLATVAERIIVDFPQYYPMFAEQTFTWEDITQENRNPLLGKVDGADGLKTGRTKEAGFGLVASAERDGRRIIVVVTGLQSLADRRQEAERLVNWAFRAFDTEVLHPAGVPVVEAETWIGDRPSVPLAPARDVIITAPLGLLEDAVVTAHFDAPVPAPIERGQRIGEIRITVPGVDEPTVVPLQATEEVLPGNFLVRMQASAQLLTRRALATAGF
ncbi:MAG: D-alanyl-D-alanine carboxypeptidase family protein [Pseudomonadota bacterium]